MTQSINVRHVLIAVSVPVSLHSHASSVPVFNGLNFPYWSLQVQFHLGVLDLDLAFQAKSWLLSRMPVIMKRKPITKLKQYQTDLA